MNPRDYTWDIETYPNTFTCRSTHVSSQTKYVFEVSDRRDDRTKLFEFLTYLRSVKARMVGFNNIWFDWEVTQWFYENPYSSVEQIYAKAMRRIKGDNSFPMWPDRRFVEQIDLLKIHHFDNLAKATSLKALEIAMRMESVEDLPFPVGTHLNHQQKDVLLDYNDHDVDATTDFYKESYEMIAFREELTEKYGRDFMNHNDTKIGAEVFIIELEKAGIPCYERNATGKRVPRQTLRSSIDLSQCIFPYVRLEHPAFLMVLDYLKAQVIKETKGVFSDIRCTPGMVRWMDPKKVKVWLKGAKKPRRLCHIPADSDFTDAKYIASSLHCRIDGFNYEFGTGGLHASLHREIVHSTDTHKIIDWDYTSWYPKIAINNRIYPAHLGEKFCDIYEFLYTERLRVGKKTKLGGAFKLALNGTYGNSNNEHSPFFDPMYTMKITINGQLSLCMTVEQLIKVPGLRMIQCNTDGITFRCPVEYLDHIEKVKQWSMAVTKGELEEVRYSRFFIRDVNNYIAEYEDGGVKRKGAYEYKREWHKDHSSLVIQKAVEAHMLRGEDISAFIFSHTDPFDFMIRGKVNRDSSLQLVYQNGYERKTGNTIRYFVSHTGGALIKRSIPKGVPGTWKRKTKITDQYYQQILEEITGQPGEQDAAGVPHDVRIHTKKKSMWGSVTETGLCSGQLVTECSNLRDFDWANLLYDWYIAQANKLVIK
ncbi:MAG: DNA polymerase B [Siphoviridae sp. ctdc_1]|nr:MAG: DNA polymerase B [Siphoviridae sp. ctdc_1]